ncbi:MAG TPA: sigma-70 family RNA polymerase sigma factor [Candidatus Acidoferrum sp.]|nr:sigma-70 family RNA polymerase sigma factor [Candidatus Acidoferrum sp.]
MLEPEEKRRFEECVLPHLDAAFNLALWLLRDKSNAEDATQEAILRAYRFFGTYRTGDARAWLLQIVRNYCYTWLRKNRPQEDTSVIEEDLMPSSAPSPEALAIASHDRERVSSALEALPTHFREIFVLRELEGCSYKEIAAITSHPIGTVMSALARARKQLKNALSESRQKESSRAV